MATEVGTETLNLDEIAAPERDTAIIGGEEYELMGPKDFNFKQYSELVRLIRAHDAELDNEAKREQRMSVFRLAFVECPEEALSKLDTYKSEHLLDFLSSRLASRIRVLNPETETTDQETTSGS